MTVMIQRGGLVVASDGGESAREPIPLVAASVHYWRLSPSEWRSALSAVKGLGFSCVDTYVPWSVHEQSDGEYDFGRNKAALDVALFLRIAGELGLYAIVRPGPHINAELTHFGIPERVIWDSACQARGATGAPVVLPFIPRMFPVPSYASEAFHGEVARYFQALAPVLAPLCAPAGPIVMVQIDNEGAMYFRDGAYEQDYHPDALAQYREYLRERYPDVASLREAYPGVTVEAEDPRFEDVMPPTTFHDVDLAAEEGRRAAEGREALAYHLDWAGFQEHLLARALARFAGALRSAGMPALPTSHNFPMAQDATPLNSALVGEGIDLIGLDYYNRARPADRAMIARRTSELAVFCDEADKPAYAPEMGAGFPPYFPPLSERDSAFTLLVALAYGLRGFNLYMAVERDRWIGAPVDRRGRARASADFYKQLNATLSRVAWAELRRRVPVRIVLPRVERRLARVLHAFGPASPALLGVSGLGPREGCVEEELGLQGLAAVDVDTLLRAFEHALESRGVPFAVVGGEQPERALAGAQWAIVLTSGGFDDALAQELARARERGVRITVGPHWRDYDDRMRPLASPWSLEAERIEATDPRSVDAAVAAHVEDATVPLYACDPDGVYVTVHEDAGGAMRVAFVINTGDQDLVARVTLGIEADWEDVFHGDHVRSEGGVLEVRMLPRTVRMLTINE